MTDHLSRSGASPKPMEVRPRGAADDLKIHALREVERLLALAELLYDGTATDSVIALSFEDDDPMQRAAECVEFAHRQAEDVVSGLRRASARIRDDLRIARRFP